MNQQSKWKQFFLVGLIVKVVMMIGLAVLSGGLIGCRLPTVQAGPLQTRTEAVELGGAESATVQIDMGVGELDIEGGAKALLDADFTYNIADWEPEVNYVVQGEDGRLTIKQPTTDNLNTPSDTRYTWDLRLNDAVRLDLQVNLGASASTLDLRGLNLHSLDLRSGAGDVAVQLADTSLDTAVVETGVGKLVLDLRGDWQQDAAIGVEAGIGDLTVIVPRGVNAKIRTDLGLGDLDVSGFTRSGGVYVHETGDATAPTLQMDIQGGVGQITLELANQ